MTTSWMNQIVGGSPGTIGQSNTGPFYVIGIGIQATTTHGKSGLCVISSGLRQLGKRT